MVVVFIWSSESQSNYNSFPEEKKKKKIKIDGGFLYGYNIIQIQMVVAIKLGELSNWKLFNQQPIKIFRN